VRIKSDICGVDFLILRGVTLAKYSPKIQGNFIHYFPYYLGENFLARQAKGCHMDRFKTCFQDAKLDDLRYSGMYYTWMNQCPENLIMQKLDRVLVNEKWSLNFPLLEARFFAF
jgi:hypothetical protein